MLYINVRPWHQADPLSNGDPSCVERIQNFRITLETRQLSRFIDCTAGWMTGVRFPAEVGITFLFATTSRPLLEHAKPPVQRMLGALIRY
jgi:hypothetical protein